MQGAGAVVAGARVALNDIHGNQIGALTWEPAMPGQDLRSVLLPSIAIVVLIMAALLAWWLNRVETTVRQLTNNDANHPA